MEAKNDTDKVQKQAGHENSQRQPGNHKNTKNRKTSHKEKKKKETCSEQQHDSVMGAGGKSADTEGQRWGFLTQLTSNIMLVYCQHEPRQWETGSNSIVIPLI